MGDVRVIEAQLQRPEPTAATAATAVGLVIVCHREVVVNLLVAAEIGGCG
jgi:hypothetical protein